MALTEQPQADPVPDPVSCPLPKDEAIALIQAMPADSSYSELIAALRVRQETWRGIEQGEAGHMVSTEEARRVAQSWRR
ncbi:MAG: hypothetical protein ACRCT8_10280 [Lacipirellulaceae bacterium]